MTFVHKGKNKQNSIGFHIPVTRQFENHLDNFHNSLFYQNLPNGMDKILDRQMTERWMEDKEIWGEVNICLKFAVFPKIPFSSCP